jgi:hypothetical protein
MYHRYIVPAITTICIVIFAIAACQTTATSTKEIKDPKLKHASQLLENIEERNSKIPAKLLAYITVRALVDKTNYNATGTLYFTQNPRKIKVKLKDIIFKSPVLQLLLKENIVQIYSPAEETLYVRKQNELEQERNYEINPGFITTIGMGRIPILSDYTITKMLHAQKSKKKEEYIILENDLFYETISFRNAVPNKIMIVNKKNKHKLEIYYHKPFVTKGFMFYRRIKGYSAHTGNRFTITYNKIKTNAVFNEESTFMLKVPRNVKIK